MLSCAARTAGVKASSANLWVIPCSSAAGMRRKSVHRQAQPPVFLFQLAAEKVADQPGDLLPVRLQGEMPGVEQMHFRLRVVALVSLGAGRQEERVVFAPDSQNGRLACAEELLEFRIERDVGLIVAEQVQLNVRAAGLIQVHL